MLKCCFNKKVLYGLGGLGLAIFLFAPSARHYLPVLASLVCPLSMGAMMFGMSKVGGKKTPTQSTGTLVAGSGSLESTDRDVKLASLRARIAEIEATEPRTTHR